MPNEDQLVLLGAIRVMLDQIEAAHVGEPVAICLPPQGQPAFSVIYGLPVRTDDSLPGSFGIELAPFTLDEGKR